MKNCYSIGGSYSTVYGSVSGTLQIFQTAAVLEILHAALGLTRSNVQVSLLVTHSDNLKNNFLTTDFTCYI